jgi:hypothetical protein
VLNSTARINFIIFLSSSCRRIKKRYTVCIFEIGEKFATYMSMYIFTYFKKNNKIVDNMALWPQFN